ncbi:MAG: DNA alkylation repair protein [Bacteroidetes bacterium]|nr:DNA alkylation repair protein [Bacteroidota bacterium]
MINLLSELQKEVKQKSNIEKAKFLQRFFKTGKGDYAEGDVFAGLTNPISHKIAKKYFELTFTELTDLIKSKIHEERLIALIILVNRFKKNKEEQEKIFKFYIKNKKYINNWDLVDLSAHKIVGCYLFEKDKSILTGLANSKNLWDRRISIISTLYSISKGSFEQTLKIADLLIADKQDLIHKAVGWMLREIGKRDMKVLEKFLKNRYSIMPRTMLRYSIEKFEESKRQKYLKNKI